MRLFVLILAAAAVVSGCQLLGFEGGDDDDHRDIWASKNDGSYSYVLNRGCFCWPAGNYWVQVEDYKVQTVINTHTQEPLDSTLFAEIETIEDMFDLIDRARSEGADELDVEYSKDGYPTSITIDWYKQAVDDEMYLGVSEVIIGVQKVD